MAAPSSYLHICQLRVRRQHPGVVRILIRSSIWCCVHPASALRRAPRRSMITKHKKKHKRMVRRLQSLEARGGGGWMPGRARGHVGPRRLVPRARRAVRLSCERKKDEGGPRTAGSSGGDRGAAGPGHRGPGGAALPWDRQLRDRRSGGAAGRNGGRGRSQHIGKHRLPAGGAAGAPTLVGRPGSRGDQDRAGIQPRPGAGRRNTFSLPTTTSRDIKSAPTTGWQAGRHARLKIVNPQGIAR